MKSLEPAPAEQTTQELLTRVLRSPRAAERISQEFPLRLLIDAQRGELGISETGYARLMSAIELGRRVIEANAPNPKLPVRIGDPSAAIEFCRQHFARIITDAKQEMFYVITLTTKLAPISTHCISVGTLDSSLVHPREIFRPAIRDAADSVLLAHNHPSGDPEPSQDDLNVTKRLEESGELVGIEITDHIVMARQGCVSIMEHRKSTR